MVSTTLVAAQVIEVKGVAVKTVCYEKCDESSSWDHVYGYEYENFNKFAVTVEAEQWRNNYDRVPADAPDYIVATKVFILQPGEKYIWKVGMSSERLYYTKFKAFKNS